MALDMIVGKIFVLEGCDYSGKDTQMAILRERLEREGRRYKTEQFHRIATPIGKLITDVLKGRHGIEPKKLSMECLSMLFAEDRRQAAPRIKEWLADGELILLNRYTQSNEGFQLAKVPDVREREAKLAWLRDLEYNRFGIPQADAVAYLHLPPEIAAERRKKARGESDLHDRDTAYQKQVQDTYLWLARQQPERWTIIQGMAGTRERTEQEIHNDVYATVAKVMGW